MMIYLAADFYLHVSVVLKWPNVVCEDWKQKVYPVSLGGLSRMNTGLCRTHSENVPTYTYVHAHLHLQLHTDSTNIHKYSHCLTSKHSLMEAILYIPHKMS